MPKTKSICNNPTTTKSVVVKHAKSKSTAPESAALPMANARTSISVAELPKPQRATASRERKVGHPNFALNLTYPKSVMNACNVTLSAQKQTSQATPGMFTRDVPITRWNYTVPIPLQSILEVCELIVPEEMSALALHNIQMLNDKAFANVRLPSYASVLHALMTK